MEIIIVILCIALPIGILAVAIEKNFNIDLMEKIIAVVKKIKNRNKSKIGKEKSDLHNIIFDFLVKEGYRPNSEEPGIVFKHQGTVMQVYLLEDDPNYFGIFSVINFDNEINKSIVKLINEYNQSFKLLRAYYDNNNAYFIADSLVFDSHNVIPSLTRIFSIVLHSVAEFEKELSQYSSHKLN